MKKLILNVMLLSVASVQAITVRNENPVTFEQFSNLLEPVITSGLLDINNGIIPYSGGAKCTISDSHPIFYANVDRLAFAKAGTPQVQDVLKKCIIRNNHLKKDSPEYKAALQSGSAAYKECQLMLQASKVDQKMSLSGMSENNKKKTRRFWYAYDHIMDGKWDYALENKWVSAIQSGYLQGASYYRALLTEYLVGRLRVGASVFGSGTFVPEDQLDVVKRFVSQADVYLAQARYYRNILVGTRSHIVQERIKDAQSKDKSGLEYGGVTIKQERERNYFTPIDTFAGVMVVNRTPEKYHVHLGQDTEAGIKIASNHVGLCQVKGTSDAWLTGEAKSSRAIDFSFIAAGNLTVNGQAVRGTAFRKFGFRVDYDLLLKETTITYSDDGGAALPLAFDQEKLKKFFGDVGPWAFMVNVVADEQGHQTTEILGLIRLNSYEFPLKFTGPTKGLADGKNGAFDEQDFLNIPTNLYKMTQPKIREKVLPLANRFLQGVFNGYLMMSSYHKDWVTKFNVEYGENGHWTQGVYMRHLFYQPKDSQWFMAAGPRKLPNWNTLKMKGPETEDDKRFRVNQVDWKFLRGLMITKKALSMMYITKKAVVNIKSIFDNPTKSIKDASGKTIYIGATDHYVPVIAVQKGGK